MPRVWADAFAGWIGLWQRGRCPQNALASFWSACSYHFAVAVWRAKEAESAADSRNSSDTHGKTGEVTFHLRLPFSMSTQNRYPLTNSNEKGREHHARGLKTLPILIFTRQ
jgi:hypothetical protein